MVQCVIYLLSSKIYVCTFKSIYVIYVCVLCYIIYVFILLFLCLIQFKIYLYIYNICHVFLPVSRRNRSSTSIHSWKGVFCIKKPIRNTTVLIHTGGVDAMWRLSKSADQSQQPSEPKADAKHQGLAMAVDELQSKKPFGNHPGRSLQKRMAT